MRLRQWLGGGIRRRETSQPVLSTSIAQAEVDRYEERLFVTAGWGSGWGVAVPEAASTRNIGALVREGLEEARRKAQPVAIGLDAHRKRERERKRGWERFCRTVVGTTVERYRPEIRIEVLDLDDGVLRVRALLRGARPDDKAELTLPSDADAVAIGDVVVRLLTETAPDWPSFRRATLATEAHGRFVLYPHRGVAHSGPVRVFDRDVETAALGASIRAVLDESGPASGDISRAAFDDALKAAGVDGRDLAGGAQAGIEETTRGAIVIDAWRPAGEGWESADFPVSVVEDGDVEKVAEAARAILDRIPTRHRKPGMEAGVPFGYKTAWLAVRGRTSDVVDALGLTNTHEMAWAEGIHLSQEGGVFVTPASGGWVLAVGVGLFRYPPDGVRLSGRLRTEVQFFSTHRVPEAHSWQLAREGALQRRVSYVGESGILEETGEPTAIEERLGLVELTEQAAIESISEETVMQVAEAWSLNPQKLATTPTTSGMGTFGERARA